MIRNQNDLIGAHPISTDIFSVWLSSIDKAPSATLKHRELTPDPQKRSEAVERITDWLLCHHISEDKLNQLKAKRRILKKYGFKEFVDMQSLLPKLDTTQKGNCAEVILAEYLVCTSGLELLIYKLHYNPNVDQSMKGDDVLLLNMDKIDEKIIVGESKFQKTPNQAVVKKITDVMGNNTILPISLSFVENRLREKGKKAHAKKVAELQSMLHQNKIDIINVGFVMSDHNTHSHVSTHGNTLNPNLVFISLAIDNPEDFIREIYAKANKKIEDIESCPLHKFPIEYAAELVKAGVKDVIDSFKSLMTK